MEQAQFIRLISEVQERMASTLAAHRTRMQPLATVLRRVQRVIVDRCPVPSLMFTGIPQLAEIENWDIKGIPWQNTILIRRDLADWEGVHFHELLHIIQREGLGATRYLTAWAIGTITRGYRGNPLEEMACRHQSRFDSAQAPYDVVRDVTTEIADWPESHFDIRKIAPATDRVDQ